MSILIIWLLSIIPLLIAGGLWIYHHQFNWIEALVLTGLGFIIAGIFHIIGIKGMTYDTEIWSGKVIDTTFIPAWTEYYEEAIYKTETYTDTELYTDGKGHSRSRTVTKTRRVFSHWAPRTCQHSEQYLYSSNLGENSIDKSRYMDITNKFGNKINKKSGSRSTCKHNSRLLYGDSYDYVSINITNHVYPVHTSKSWENKIKACPSVFSFAEVPKTIHVHEYPKVNNEFMSNRVINAPISIYQWDQLNAELGPRKKVNLIIIGFKDEDEKIAEWQRAKWIGGKKNDIVICFGYSDIPTKANWCKVFGWTEKEIVKVNLEQLLLQTSINNDIVPKIKEIIITDYIIKDWKKFDYLTVEVPFSIVIWYIIGQILLCGGWIWFSLKNEFEKSDKELNLIKKGTE